MSNIENSTYLSQVRKLRQLAAQALKNYPLEKYQLKFINHGENTTFRVVTKKENYLLRIHRANYHAHPALLEEIAWLKRLSIQTDIPVQKPVAAKNGQYLVKVKTPAVLQGRFCSLLQWQEGQIKNSKKEQNYFDIGVLTAKLQSHSMKTRYRKYWTTEGLLGENATLGPLHTIKKQFPKEYKTIKPLRDKSYSLLKRYEQAHPHKLSLIHADLHFGNMLWRKGVIHPIDFDDCGHGFQMYDLAVTLYSSYGLFKRVGKKEAYKMQQALFDGYSTYKELTQQDIEILPHMIRTRELTIIGWLYARKDNPKLAEYLVKNFPKIIQRAKEAPHFYF